jgi:hypothetical protein
MTQGSSRQRQARAVRAIVEATLDATGWLFSRRLSLWLDALLVLEEGERSA